MKVGENIDLQFNFSIIKTPRINYFPIFQTKNRTNNLYFYLLCLPVEHGS